jgi:hypothetical protein
MARFTARRSAPQAPSTEKWLESPLAGTLAMKKPVASDKKPWWRNIVA